MSDSGNQGSFPVRVDFERILETIAKSIYDNQYAFLRENVQNAIDAVRIQSRRDRAEPDDPRYRIDIQIEGKNCTISDNGIGMTHAELVNNFWTMGASGKNTPEAKEAGCIGTFGIGGFANFGVCETLIVTSRTTNCAFAHRTKLSKAAFAEARFDLPRVDYTETEDLAARGTIVHGITKEDLDVAGLLKYVRQFTRHVREAIFFKGNKISQEPFEKSTTSKRLLGGLETRDGVSFQLSVDQDSSLSAEIRALALKNRQELDCNGYVRLVNGVVDVFKRGFRLCSTAVGSRIGISGWLDCDVLRPTAGRDTLDSESVAILTKMFSTVERAACDHILRDSALLSAHVRLIPSFVQQGRLEDLGELEVDLVLGEAKKLREIRAARSDTRKVYYTTARGGNATTEVLSARGHTVVVLSGNSQRRSAEISFLRNYCDGTELDRTIECLEVYQDVDTFERGVLSELTLSIRKLFKPREFKLVAGKLTLDTPIYWTGKEEGGVVVVYVDTRHGEFSKLRPLGYTALFWSMIEAFCREYLGDTLKRQSTKFFGNGAIDLEAFNRDHAELWELVIDDIAVSKVGSSDGGARPGGGRFEVVRKSDIANVTITATGAAVADGADQRKGAPKLLRVIDTAGLVGISGYYLRIPESSTAAFGEIIRTFPAFAVVWFANRITWQGTDLSSTAFLFDVTLDRLLGSGASEALRHGAMELSSKHVQSFQDQLYFFIPQILHDYVVPKERDLIKIEIRHELIDLNRVRSWTAKEERPRA